MSIKLLDLVVTKINKLPPCKRCANKLGIVVKINQSMLLVYSCDFYCCYFNVKSCYFYVEDVEKLEHLPVEWRPAEIYPEDML